MVAVSGAEGAAGAALLAHGLSKCRRGAQPGSFPE